MVIHARWMTARKKMSTDEQVRQFMATWKAKHEQPWGVEGTWVVTRHYLLDQPALDRLEKEMRTLDFSLINEHFCWRWFGTPANISEIKDDLQWSSSKLPLKVIKEIASHVGDARKIYGVIHGCRDNVLRSKFCTKLIEPILLLFRGTVRDRVRPHILVQGKNAEFVDHMFTIGDSNICYFITVQAKGGPLMNSDRRSFFPKLIAELDFQQYNNEQRGWLGPISGIIFFDA